MLSPLRAIFDDCQDLVKGARSTTMPSATAYSWAGVNSINWARIMAQIAHYFVGLSVGALDRPVSFTVPTGNFGDIFAGYAKRMGLLIESW